MRSALSPILKTSLPKQFALSAAALFFAIYHLIGLGLNPEFQAFILLQVLFSCVIGLFLNWIWLQEQSLLATVSLHFLVNATFLIFVMIYFPS